MKEIAKSINKRSTEDDKKEEPIERGDGDDFDKMTQSNNYDLLKIEEDKLTKDKVPVLRRILNRINENKQTLSTTHSGGGIGKTHLIKIASDKALHIKKNNNLHMLYWKWHNFVN